MDSGLVEELVLISDLLVVVDVDIFDSGLVELVLVSEVLVEDVDLVDSRLVEIVLLLGALVDFDVPG